MKYIFFLFLLLGVFSCSRSDKRQIVKVELGRSGAWSYRGGAISIDSAKNYQYFGQMDVHEDHQPSFIGKVSSKQWKELVTKIDSIDFEKTDSTANLNGADESYFELVVYWNNRKKRIVRQASFFTGDQVSNVLEWLNLSYKNVELKKVSDSLNFGTTFQSGKHFPDPNERKLPGK